MQKPEKSLQKAVDLGFCRTDATAGQNCTHRPSEKLDHHVGEPRLTQSTVQVSAENVNLVNDFVYFGSMISHDGGNEAGFYYRPNALTVAQPKYIMYTTHTYTHLHFV